MGLRQFISSINSIMRNRHIHRGRGLLRHLQWQLFKAFDRFPFEQSLSESRIVARHRRCSVSALIYSQGLYDYNNMKLLQLLLQDGGVFLDIGANIGSFTLVASEVERGLVVAVEPHPETFKMLACNVEINRRTNVRLFNVAVGCQDGSVLMTDVGGSPINHIVQNEGADTVRVPCSRIDTLCRQHNFVPRVVKVDVEGFEHDVLIGFGSLLESVDVLMIEMNGLSERRSVGFKETDSFLKRHWLIGPLECNFDGRTLTPSSPGQSEDVLYVSRSFVRSAPSRGLCVRLGN
ncbi:MAG: FkbM family methyltransferase [Nitrospira sp. CR1.3]|nr:FkbM family methyltransferase [Nitrospira sp. CR1.3]